jgi:hypothetical protein
MSNLNMGNTVAAHQLVDGFMSLNTTVDTADIDSSRDDRGADDDDDDRDDTRNDGRTNRRDCDTAGELLAHWNV